MEDKIHLSLSSEDLKIDLGKQLELYFPDGATERYFRGKDMDIAFYEGIERLEYCFQHINLEAYSNDKRDAFFSHLHADKYSQFLYYGEAGYSDYFMALQNVTINTGAKDNSECMLWQGEGVYMVRYYRNNTIGDCVSGGVNAVVYDQVIRDCKLVVNC